MEPTIKVTKIAESKLKNLSLDNIPFGKFFTDHMLVADYENGEWTNVEIKPYGEFLIDPSMTALHYGQAIFEGIKAYKKANGEVFIFRPYDNYLRFNKSAARMCMPNVPEHIFMDGMKQLISLDKNWVPNLENHSLYIRPYMFSSDNFLGVRPSDTYKFLIILSPSGPYYAKPMKIMVEEKYTRAAKGGVGFSKNAGNYGGSLLAAKEAQAKGYDQVLWTDATEHKWLQEVGMMNVFFVIDGKIYTPSLEDGTILDGVTRKTLIQLLKNEGHEVIQKPLHIDEVLEAHKRGVFTEMFGSGTAASVGPVAALGYRDVHIEFDANDQKFTKLLTAKFNAIKAGLAEDKYGWVVNVD